MSAPKLTILYLAFATVSVAGSIVYCLGGGPAATPPEAVDSSLVLKEPIGETEWILVEFGDFECPACRRVAPEIDAFLTEYKGKVKFEFRHMVLKRHKLAGKAAVACEAARKTGQFDSCRRFFMDAKELNAEALAEGSHRFAAHATPVEMGQAAARLGVDMAAASRLNIDAIPALFLVGRQGKAYRLRSLAQAQSVMR